MAKYLVEIFIAVGGRYYDVWTKKIESETSIIGPNKTSETVANVLKEKGLAENTQYYYSISSVDERDNPRQITSTVPGTFFDGRDPRLKDGMDYSASRAMGEVYNAPPPATYESPGKPINTNTPVDEGSNSPQQWDSIHYEHDQAPAFLKPQQGSSKDIYQPRPPIQFPPSYQYDSTFPDSEMIRRAYDNVKNTFETIDGKFIAFVKKKEEIVQLLLLDRETLTSQPMTIVIDEETINRRWKLAESSTLMEILHAML